MMALVDVYDYSIVYFIIAGGTLGEINKYESILVSFDKQWVGKDVISSKEEVDRR